ncbi:hypothetical protein PMAYCL1PPCAC_00585, partial [Pristionchus mayeri]
ERFVRNHWTKPSSPQTSEPVGVKATEKARRATRFCLSRVSRRPSASSGCFRQFSPRLSASCISTSYSSASCCRCRSVSSASWPFARSFRWLCITVNVSSQSAIPALRHLHYIIDILLVSGFLRPAIASAFPCLVYMSALALFVTSTSIPIDPEEVLHLPALLSLLKI